MGPPLLGGAWHDLAVCTWLVNPAELAPHLPSGVELDTWEGQGLISVVGVTFRDLRVLGVPLPGLQAFAQVNVRIYVRRRVGREVRHGVRFLLQLAPSRLIVAAARLALHEPYVACSTRVEHAAAPGGRRRVTYAWEQDSWQQLRLHLGAASRTEAGRGSLETFILQRCWGYTPQPDGRTLEYAVRHPLWRVRAVEGTHVPGTWPAGLLPTGVARALAQPPTVVTFAEGSAIEVHRPRSLQPGPLVRALASR